MNKLKKHTVVSLLMLALMPNFASADTTPSGVQVDVNTINRSLTPKEMIDKIEETITSASEYIKNVEHATEVMSKSLTLSKRVVAQCELRNENSIIGKFARQAYIYSCSEVLVELRGVTKKYSMIADELTEYLPVAHQMIEDNLLSKDQLLVILQAEKAKESMVEVIDNTNRAKQALNDVL
jgi:dGTP triphosphohydrolase